MKLKLEIAVKPKKLSNYAKSQKLCKGLKAKGEPVYIKHDYPAYAPKGANDWFESLIEFDEELNIPIV